MSYLLPVHGFVLAGGKSSRMGVDKATLPFQGRPMVEIALEKLRGFCADVSIVGNRNDLEGYAAVVQEGRLNAGPAAGIEAGLRFARQEWAMFIPVDVPLVPETLLRLWCEEALRVDMTVSYLGVTQKQPAFCMLKRERLASFTHLLNGGERRLEVLLNLAASTDNCASWMYDELDLYGYPDYQGPDNETLTHWFSNVNSPADLAEAEAWAKMSTPFRRGGS